MKRVILFLCALVMGAMLWAQVPQTFSYQAVVRNNAGQPLVEQSVGVRLSLRQGSANGTEVYAELHTVTTNVAGLITLAVGEGAVQTQTTLADIDWANGPWYLCTAVDPTGGTNYVLNTVQQLHAVPYALHATDAEAQAQVAALEGKVDSLQVVNAEAIATNAASVEANAEAIATLTERTDSLYEATATGVETNAEAIAALTERTDSLYTANAAGVEANAEAIAALTERTDSLYTANAAGVETNAEAIAALTERTDSLYTANAAGVETNAEAIAALTERTDSLYTANAAGVETNTEAIAALAGRTDSLYAANAAGVEANTEAITALTERTDSLYEATAAGVETNAEAIAVLTAENDSLKAENTAMKAELAALGARMQQYVDSAIAAALQSIGSSDTNNGAETPAPTTVPEGYVDLGLPSGLLWATCNLGATSPEEYGDYYAWGETTTKSTYDWSNYQYATGSSTTLTKYCNDSDYGNNGFTDNLTTLLPEDDAATQVLGTGARIPTKAEWQELIDNTTAEWTTMNGVNGRLFTAANGNILFLPAAGDRFDGSLYNAGSYGYYWSASLNEGYPFNAWGFYFNSGYQNMYYNYRNYGQSVRAVRASEN